MSTHSGFAVRYNGSCLPAETDCGFTARPYRGCCPAGLACPSQYNIACCPPGQNCTEALVTGPVCADPEWDLYDNRGYFCCRAGTTGYASRTNSDGCAVPGYSFKRGEELLKVISAGGVQNSTTPSTSPTSTSQPSSPTSTTSPGTQSDGSSTPVGAIAGGVVTGVVILAVTAVAIWFLLRRRKARQSATGSPTYKLEESAVRLMDKNRVHGIHDDNVHAGSAEFPGTGYRLQSPVELPGSRPEA